MGSPCERCNDLTFDGICRTKEKAAGAWSLGTYPDTFPEFPALARLGETCEACHLVWDELTSAITFDTDKDAEPYEDAGATVTYALAHAAEPGIPGLPWQGPATDDMFSRSLRLRIDIELPPGTRNKSHYSIKLPIKPLNGREQILLYRFEVSNFPGTLLILPVLKISLRLGSVSSLCSPSSAHETSTSSRLH